MLSTCFSKFTTWEELRLPECLTAVFSKYPAAWLYQVLVLRALFLQREGIGPQRLVNTLRTRNFGQVTKILYYRKQLYRSDFTVVFVLWKSMKTTQMTLWANYSELAIARESATVTLRDSKAGTWPRKLYSVKTKNKK